MSFVMCMVAVILGVLSFRVQRRFDRCLVQLASFLMLVYFLHQLHVF
jgi:hypothetical protein